MADVINFLKFRPVNYTVHLSHSDDGFSVSVMDVEDSKESRERVSIALIKAANMITGDIERKYLRENIEEALRPFMSGVSFQLAVGAVLSVMQGESNTPTPEKE